MIYPFSPCFLKRPFGILKNQHTGFPRKQISTGMIIDESNPPHDLIENRHDWLQEREVQNELRQMTRKCIDLKIKLTEEQSHVEELANRTGPFMRKALSQEVIKLRRDNDSLIYSLKAASLKLQEVGNSKIIYSLCYYCAHSHRILPLNNVGTSC